MNIDSQILNKENQKRILSRVNWCFPWAVPMFHTMFAGLVLSQLCLILNMSDMEIGMVNAIPNLVLPLQLLSAYLVINSVPRKTFFMVLGIVSRLFMVLIACTLLLKINESLSMILFVLFFLGFHISFAMGIPLWFSWAGDLVPGNQSAKFFGDRNAIAFVSGMVYVLIYGFVLDTIDDTRFALALILGASGVTACIELLFYKSIPAVEKKEDAFDLNRLRWFIDPFKHKNFVRLAIVGVFYNISFYLVMPFFFIYFKEMGYSSLMIQMGMGLHAIGVALSSKLWAKLATKIKKKGILIYALLLKVCVLAFMGIVDKSTTLTSLSLLFFIDGCTVGGWFTSSFSMLTSETPKRLRSMMMALFFSTSGMAGFVASIVSGLWMESFAVNAEAEWMDGKNSFQMLCWLAAVILPLGIFFMKNYTAVDEN